MSFNHFQIASRFLETFYVVALLEIISFLFSYLAFSSFRRNPLLKVSVPRGSDPILTINPDKPLYASIFSRYGVCLCTYVSSGGWHVCLMPPCAAGERDQYYLPHLVAPTLLLLYSIQHPSNILILIRNRSALILPGRPIKWFTWFGWKRLFFERWGRERLSTSARRPWPYTTLILTPLLSSTTTPLFVPYSPEVLAYLSAKRVLMFSLIKAAGEKIQMKKGCDGWGEG